MKPDGRKPRVKSNIKQRLANNGRPFAGGKSSHKIPVPSDLFEPKNVDKRKISDAHNLLNEVTLVKMEDHEKETTTKMDLLGKNFIHFFPHSTNHLSLFSFRATHAA